MKIKFNPALIRTQNLLKMWQSINGLIDQRTPKGFKSVLLSLGNVVHSDNNGEFVRLLLHTEGDRQRASAEIGRPQKFFQGGGQRQHFAYPLLVVDDATQMDVHKPLHSFYTTKKCPVLRQQLHTVFSL